MEKSEKLVYNESKPVWEEAKMLFRKNIEPRCAYCTYAAPAEEGTVICRKKGIRMETDKCRKFKYDPLKRVPPRPVNLDFTKYDERDYSL